jgi:hypothetical protein
MHASHADDPSIQNIQVFEVHHLAPFSLFGFFQAQLPSLKMHHFAPSSMAQVFQVQISCV